jgi:hypothetical protein
MSYNLPEIELLLKDGIPIGTVFDLIMQNPHRYCSPELATAILNNFEEYQKQIANLRLKEGYSLHLHGASVLKSLFGMGFPEYLLVKYVVYPLTYQFRTHLPFLDYIQPIDNFPEIKYCSSPIIEEYQGSPHIVRGSHSFPIVRYAIPGGGTEFSETPLDICGTFYYPEAKSDVILRFDSCLIAHNKIVAYSYLFGAGIEEIVPNFITLDEYSYFEGPLLFKSSKCGFGEYYIELNGQDLKATYELIKSDLTSSFDDIVNMVMNSDASWRTQTYFQELIREGDDIDNIKYIYRGQVQEKDLILFMISYVKYAAIKMMLNNTWNWRVSILYPYTQYDQLLCQKAREMKIDVIILTTEISTGMYSIRSEIVDTRSREESYANLRIRNDPTVLKTRQYEILEIRDIC